VAQDLRSRLFCQKWIVHLWIGIYRNKSTRHTWTTILGFSARKGLRFLAHLGVGISRRFVVTTRLFLPLSRSATDRNFTLSRIGRGYHGDAGLWIAPGVRVHDTCHHSKNVLCFGPKRRPHSRSSALIDTYLVKLRLQEIIFSKTSAIKYERKEN